MNLTEKYRPTTFDDVIGQDKAVALVKSQLTAAHPISMILYGPPGCGKTTTAKIFATQTSSDFIYLNATIASTADIKAAFKTATKNKQDNPDAKTILYIDEIHFLNVTKQQLLLPYIEDGTVVLIGSTSKLPYHQLDDALLSRCMPPIEFTRVPFETISPYLTKLVQHEDVVKYMNQEAIDFVAHECAGDLRRALNILDSIVSIYTGTASATRPITEADVESIMPSTRMASFDTHGDSHYAFISAMQKSIRGSDPDAAVFWLSKLLEGGDIISPARRLPVIALEDIGLADPLAIIHTKTCCDEAEHLGLPEAYKPLTQAVLYLALAPKSASNERTWMQAQEDIHNGLGATVPSHVASEHARNYIWPQDKPYHWIPQQYLPDDLLDRHYYTPDDNPNEQSRYAYWQQVKQAYQPKDKE